MLFAVGAMPWRRENDRLDIDRQMNNFFLCKHSSTPPAYNRTIKGQNRIVRQKKDQFRKEKVMKKLFFLLGVALLVSSCSSGAVSEFAKHDKMYKNWDHMKYSWWGYRNPSEETMQQSIDEGWWGTDVPYVPGE